jgi:hypothetical protein
VNVLDIPISIGRYEILERVARGGMGALYRARDPVLEREVAIKVMLADFSHDVNGRTRFYREARAIARLQHRNIVTLFDYGEDEGNPFIVMEFLQGQTLAARVKHGPPVPPVQAFATGAQLCTGLHFAHGSGIVHRDVKPANIWLEDDGGVKLLDFGIAKFGDTDVTQAGDVLGSISYMSPEQLAGGTIDGRSDIFSAGIVMYELLTGRRPFQGESPTAIMMKIIHEEAPPLDEVPGAPPKLRGMIAKALEKNPDRRYQRAAEFASELRDLQISIERSLERQQESMRGSQTGTVPDHPVGPAAPHEVPAAQPGSVLPAGGASLPRGIMGGTGGSQPGAQARGGQAGQPGDAPGQARQGGLRGDGVQSGGVQAGGAQSRGSQSPGGHGHPACSQAGGPQSRPPGGAQSRGAEPGQQRGTRQGGARPDVAGAAAGGMLSSGEMVTATHTPGPQALRAPVVAHSSASAPMSADALLMRPAGGSVDSDDPLSDVMIGGREPVVAADAAARARAGRGGSRSRPAWVPAGAAAAIIVAVVVGFLMMRGGPMEVTGGAQAPDGASSASGVNPVAGPGASNASGSSATGKPAANSTSGAAVAAGSLPYPDSGKGSAANSGAAPGDASSASPAAAPLVGGTGAAPAANGAPGAGAGAGAGAGNGAPPVPASSSSASPSSASPSSVPPASSASAVRVMLSGSYPFEVSGDGGVLSRAKARHELSLARPQSLRLRSPEYGLDRRVEVTGKPGETVRLSAPALGRLTVRTTFETCQIFLGGIPLGYPPLSDRPIASGTYRLTLRCPDGDHQTQTVTIPAGATYMALIQ